MKTTITYFLIIFLGMTNAFAQNPNDCNPTVIRNTDFDDVNLYSNLGKGWYDSFWKGDREGFLAHDNDDRIRVNRNNSMPGVNNDVYAIRGQFPTTGGTTYRMVVDLSVGGNENIITARAFNLDGQVLTSNTVNILNNTQIEIEFTARCGDNSSIVQVYGQATENTTFFYVDNITITELKTDYNRNTDFDDVNLYSNLGKGWYNSFWKGDREGFLAHDNDNRIRVNRNNSMPGVNNDVYAIRGQFPTTGGATYRMVVDLSVGGNENIITARAFNLDGQVLTSNTVNILNNTQIEIEFTARCGDNSSIVQVYGQATENTTFFYVDNITIEAICGNPVERIGRSIDITVYDGKEDVSIYPNPAINGQFNIEFGANEYDYNVIDATGRVVKSNRNVLGKSLIDLSQSERGVYVVQIQSNEQLINKRVITIK